MIRATKKKTKAFTRQMGIRFTQEAWQRIILESSKAECSRTEYIRQLIDNGFAVNIEELRGLRTELNRIGVNINQWSAKLHAEGKAASTVRRFMADLETARYILLKIRRLGNGHSQTVIVRNRQEV